MSGNKFWSTNLSHKRTDCRIMLLYRGGMTFNDTVRKTDLEIYKLQHPMPPPPPREPTPPPPHEPTPSRPPRPEPKSGRQTLTSLLTGVTNQKKRK